MRKNNFHKLAKFRLYSDSKKPPTSYLFDEISEKVLKEYPVPVGRGERLFKLGELAAGIGLGVASQFLKRATNSSSS